MSVPESSDTILDRVRAAVKAADSWDWTSQRFRRDLARILHTQVAAPAAPNDEDARTLAASMRELIDAESESDFDFEQVEDRESSLLYFAALALRAQHDTA